MKSVAAFLAGFILAIGFSGRATEFFAEYGQCRYGAVPEGTFYQSDMHTDSFLRPTCAAIGVADKWKGSERFGWRVALLGTGSIRARDNASVNDERAHRHDRTCTPPDEDGCTVAFNGSGQTLGISLGLTAEQPLAAHLSLIGEGGFFFFQHHFKTEARFVNCASCTRQISYNETSRLWDMPSPYSGVTLRYRKVYVAARHYWPSGNRALSLTDFSMNQLVAGFVL